MSMLSNLPEETVHEILSLCITPLHFFGKYDRSGYSFNPPADKRNSQLLLVSKQWLRIGTPILYRHLRLTNQERTRTVAQVLAANEGLGLAIRALRLEGGMGRELGKIVSCAPNIESLYLARYTIRHNDSLAGLRRALPHLNVKKLYYDRDLPRLRGNKITEEVEGLLREGMRNYWQNITIVGFMYEAGSTLSADVIGAVVQLPCVEEVQFDSRDVRNLGKPETALLATITTLKTISVYNQSQEKDIRSKLKDQYSVSGEFLNKFVFIRTPRDDQRLAAAIFDSDTEYSSDEDVQ